MATAAVAMEGGAIVGDTIYNDGGVKFALYLVPWGILNTQAICVVGNGVVVHFPGFFKEIDGLEAQGVLCRGRLFVSDRAHLLFDLHQIVDGLPEAELGGDMIGTTKWGIGPCYASKAICNGLCVGDLRHMDTFRSKLEIFFKDAANQFKDFEYNYSVLDAQVEDYKKFAKRLERTLQTLSSIFLMHTR
ncbi:unnamed protein product [Sphagnum troendelagicum]|uniref:Adenylosuccinate synthetase, chloroplastic n=1 Tax=Sphagnum troendelagicum TaxID=128251 RepID=A0ABP0UUJ7_9BRYO